MGVIPHGGILVSNTLSPDQERDYLKRNDLKAIHLSQRCACDLELLSNGGYSPLRGFMGKSDYESVVHEMRLKNGLPWSIPITLCPQNGDAESVREGDTVFLLHADDQPLGIMHVTEKFLYDKKREAREVYKTLDENHPGVAGVFSQGEFVVGGNVYSFSKNNRNSFEKYRYTPAQTRSVFQEKGWQTVVGFQTRNPVHRAHEYIQKCALEMVDGLLLHPLVGETKDDDIPADIRMKCYEILLEHYYPRERVFLSVLPAPMRYAGPREAIHHALMRKNYGCTHFIVGRDHAGVGHYYGPFDAQKIFSDFQPGELGIQPLFFDNAFYCKKCNGMTSVKTCPHDKENHISLSGTRVRAMLKEGQLPPPEFSRPEVAKILIDSMSKRSLS